MKPAEVWERNFLGELEPSFYERNKEELQRTNYALLRISCVFSAVMCLFLVFVTIINPLIENLKTFYTVYALIFTVLTVLVLTVVKRRRKLIPWVFYLFAATIFRLVIDVGTVRSPELPAITFFSFLIIIPILHVTRPVYAMILTAAASAVFCVATIQVKGMGSHLAEIDVLNAICCCIVGIGVNTTILNLQLENIRSKSYLAHQSATDELTGLPNRRSFDLYIEKHFPKQRHQGNLAVLMLDIDDFKAYNDTYGHVQGDECLQQVSRALDRVAQVNGIFLARFGGEEFVCVADARSKEALRKCAVRMVDCVGQLALEHTGSAGDRVTISVGYATLQETGSTDYRDLLDCADTALYAAKAEGKNRAKGWSREDEKKA